MERIVFFAALVFCAVMLFFTPDVYAWQAYDPWIHQRFENQEHRINQGIANGQLTPSEAARLWSIQARARHKEMLMESDGRLTERERYRLHRSLDHSSRVIYRMKHNGYTTY